MINDLVPHKVKIFLSFTIIRLFRRRIILWGITLVNPWENRLLLRFLHRGFIVDSFKNIVYGTRLLIFLLGIGTLIIVSSSSILILHRSCFQVFISQNSVEIVVIILTFHIGITFLWVLLRSHLRLLEFKV